MTKDQTVKEITPLELKALLDAHEPVTLIDVREEFERNICSIGGELMPLGNLLQHVQHIPQEGKVVIYCRSGGRSGTAVAELQKKFGYANLYNLAGGILRWSDDVDATIPKY